MTYLQTLDYLFSQLPMYSRVGAAAYKEDLHNAIAICGALDNPQNKFKSIHIAGTNGKGSTSHMLAAILQEAGYKTGLYTSPHLKDFRERIKINGKMVSQSFVIDFVSRTKSLAEEIQPSFFELTMAMAFDYFSQQKVDIAIIETGLGGRLDSTNIITPILSVITNIGFDHMNILGDTLVKIAEEKAGIIKAGVPVVIGEYTHETKLVFDKKATQCNAPIYFSQDEYSIANIHPGMRQLDCSIKNIANAESNFYSLDLNGLYQLQNLRTTLSAEKELQKQGLLPVAAERWIIEVGEEEIIVDRDVGFFHRMRVIAFSWILRLSTPAHKYLGFVYDAAISKEVVPVVFSRSGVKVSLPELELEQKT